MPQEQEPMRFKVKPGDEKLWGNLVKAWAKGQKAKPANLDELKQQIQDMGMQDPDCPSFITGLVFIQNDRHILTIRLPPAKLIEAGEELIKADPDGAYKLPDYYRAFFRDPPPPLSEKLEMHAARIGEYAVNSCQ